MFESDDPLDHYHHAHSLVRDGRYAEAAKHYRRAIELAPDHLDSEVYVFAAWLLSTCPIRDVRNGRRAIEYATKACDISDWLEPWPMVALAAAHAEVGEFSKAVAVQKKAVELFSVSEYNWLNEDYRRKQEDRLARYESGQSLDYDLEP